MTRRGQWLLLLGIVVAIAGVAGITAYGLRDTTSAVDVGTRAPNFEAVTLFDHEVRSLRDDYQGKVVLINFWATWCAPCRREMPSMEKLYREFGPRGLAVVAINTQDPDATDSTVKAFADGYGLTFDVLRDMPAAGSDSMTKTFQVSGYPESFVLDREGMIRKRWSGEDDWSSQGNRALIASLLGLPVPGPGTAIGEAAVLPRGR
ncbi:MAG TPA: TlpA disulfide reductase family protein [Gemmatimonadaceae bacterium]|nr:TlpA disulfide reductase family protein [Gemmatimonadaceae bacterium]